MMGYESLYALKYAMIKQRYHCALHMHVSIILSIDQNYLSYRINLCRAHATNLEYKGKIMLKC